MWTTLPLAKEEELDLDLLNVGQVLQMPTVHRSIEVLIYTTTQL